VDLAEEFTGPLRLVRGLRRLDDLDSLGDYRSQMASALERPLAGGTDVLRLMRAVAHVNDLLTSKLLRLAEDLLGPPPCSYAWLALGSHGRGEQVLSSDQDSALAYASTDSTAGDPSEYFPRMADLVVDGLTRAGIPRCNGGYMASSWCYPLEVFTDFFHRWVDYPRPEALLQAEVFLDVRPVHGDLAVGALSEILISNQRNGYFLLQMARAAVTFRPPRVVFGHLHTDHGLLDVKRAGTASIVLLARLYAIAAGSTAHTTEQRLQAAGGAGTISESGAHQLADAYRLLTELRLRGQVEQVRHGLPVDNRVRVDALTATDRRRLHEALRSVRVVQEITENRFATHTVT